MNKKCTILYGKSRFESKIKEDKKILRREIGKSSFLLLKQSTVHSMSTDHMHGA